MLGIPSTPAFSFTFYQDTTDTTQILISMLPLRYTGFSVPKESNWIDYLLAVSVILHLQLKKIELIISLLHESSAKGETALRIAARNRHSSVYKQLSIANRIVKYIAESSKQLLRQTKRRLKAVFLTPGMRTGELCIIFIRKKYHSMTDLIWKI